jgi:hypothetical protein
MPLTLDAAAFGAAFKVGWWKHSSRFDLIAECPYRSDIVTKWRFAEARGTPFAMSPLRLRDLDTGKPEPIWDAALKLARDEEGLTREMAVVGEPVEIAVFAWLFAPPIRRSRAIC